MVQKTYDYFSVFSPACKEIAVSSVTNDKQRGFTPLEISRTCLTTVKIRKVPELRAGFLTGPVSPKDSAVRRPVDFRRKLRCFCRTSVWLPAKRVPSLCLSGNLPLSWSEILISNGLNSFRWSIIHPSILTELRCL